MGRLTKGFGWAPVTYPGLDDSWDHFLASSLSEWLPLFGWDSFERGDKCAMGGGINRPMPDRRARWVLAEVVFTSPILRRSDGPWFEAAAAIGADIV